MIVRELVEETGLAPHEAERLLMAVTGVSRLALRTMSRIARDDRLRFTEMAARRREGVPLQYLEGTVPFGEIEVLVDERALIPRPETEYLWELASQRSVPEVVVDLCTGSGVLALSAKHRWPGAVVYGSDLSPRALTLAAENAQRLGTPVVWCRGDLFEALDSALHGTIDLVLANPPYVAEAEFDSLPADVRLHEPREALIAPDGGLDVIRRLGAGVSSWLAPQGEVWCEIGESQGREALSAFAGLEARVVQDLTGRDRYVHGVRQ